MEDKELIELAAKAAGINGYRYSEGFGCMAHWNESDGGWFDACGLWDPLSNDGDALRLAARLDLIVDFSRFSAIEAGRFYVGHRDFVLGSSANEAITRAAAKIGKEME